VVAVAPLGWNSDTILNCSKAILMRRKVELSKARQTESKSEEKEAI
jgi:hypothetical protein